MKGTKSAALLGELEKPFLCPTSLLPPFSLVDYTSLIFITTSKLAGSH